MPKVSVSSIAQAPVVATFQHSSPHVESRAIFARDVDPIHAHVHVMPSGACFEADGQENDCVLYVWKGLVRAGRVDLGAGSSAVAEYGTSLRLEAADGGATLITFQLQRRDQEPPAGGRIHLLPSDRVPRSDISEKPIGSALHADAHCPTCRVWMHENFYYGADEETPLHSHSEDEVIFVTSGSVRLGARLFGPGTAVAVAANTKYGFFSGPDGLGFVNFRGASPTYSAADGSLTMDEGQFWRAAVGKPEYIFLEQEDHDSNRVRA
jgi:hypothetical protein